MKDEVSDVLQKFASVHKRVIEIYRQGKDGENPPIECPWCGKLTTGYGCAWGYNNHVHFCCEHCGNGFME